MTPEYAAGFFDGEGCVFLTHVYGRRDAKRGRTKLKISIGNTNRPVLEEFAKSYGGSVVSSTPTKPRPGRDRLPMWSWSLSEGSCRGFLRSIQPYAIVKAEQIKLALEFLEFCDWRSAEGREAGSAYSEKYGRYIPYQRYTDEAFKAGLAFIERMGKLNYRPMTGMVG